jgi:hypothetical protein
MQGIDNYFLDILFENNLNDLQSNFLQNNRSVANDMRNQKLPNKSDKLLASNSLNNKGVSNSIKDNIEISDSTKDSFKEAINKTNSKSNEKKSQKKSSDDLILEVNQFASQILNEIDHKISFEFEAKNGSELQVLQLHAYEQDIADTELIISHQDIYLSSVITIQESIQETDSQDKKDSDYLFLQNSVYPIPYISNSELNSKVIENNSELITINIKDSMLENNNLKKEVFNELGSKLENKLEILTLELAKINLKSESAVDKILDLSNQIEKISIVTEALKDLLKKSQLENTLTSDQTFSERISLEDSVYEQSLSNNREIEVLLDSLLEKFITNFHIHRSENDLNKTLSNPLKDTTKAELISIVDPIELLDQKSHKVEESVKVFNNLNRFLDLKERIEILEESLSHEDNLNLSQEAKISLNENSSIFVSNSTSSNMSGFGQQGFQGNNIQSAAIQDLQQVAASSKAINIRSLVIKQSIPMERLTNFVVEKAIQAPQGVKQDIKLLLNPENLGEVELSISKNGNKIDIKMVFVNEKSMNQVENKMNELNMVLKSRGFEAKIELSHANTDNSNNTRDQQNANSNNQNFNQAKEEQKNKYLERPSWLDEKISIEKMSFDEQLQGIIN